MFSLELQTFLDMGPILLNFIFMVALLTFLLYKPVRRILQTRSDKIENDLNDAAANKANAEELKAQYEQLIRDIEQERTSILDEAKRIAKDRQNQILSDAKAEAMEIKEKAARDIATEKERIKDDVYHAIVDISTSMAQKLILANIDKSSHDRLFAEAMDDLEATAFRSDSVAV
jgi:F-type H+-transporting ATPase subunit b